MTFSVSGLVGQVTGSKSIRLNWLTENLPTSHYKIYRGTTNVFSAATLLATLANDITIYNDYACAPATRYFYWVVRELNSVLSGHPVMVDITTDEAVVSDGAFSSTEENALWTWANNEFLSVYSTYWRYQPIDKPIKPSIVLNLLSVQPTGFNDDLRDKSERLSGARQGTMSVLVLADPKPAQRALVVVNSVGAQEYIVEIGSKQFSYTAPASPAPTNHSILAGLQAVIDPTFAVAWICGNDDSADAAQAEFLAVEMLDPNAALPVVDGTSNLTCSTITPDSAMTIANRLVSSLGDPSVRELLNSAGVGIAQVQQAQDISGALETKFELRAQFDFFINLASNRSVSTPIIDTVSSLTGTFS